MENLAVVKDDKPSENIFVRIFKKELNSEMEVIEMSQKGITKASLMAFIHFLKFTPEQFARLIPVTLRTIQRYSSEQTFSPTISEHIIQLVFLVEKGIEVFGSLERFIRWFNSPSQALGGRAPYELVYLKTGTQMVMDELGRIEYGVYG